jgi:hypothetical protein
VRFLGDIASEELVIMKWVSNNLMKNAKLCFQAHIK